MLLIECCSLTLRYILSVFAVDHITYMMGSYAPRAEPYEYVSETDEWPSGFLVRGNYVTTIKVCCYCFHNAVAVERTIVVKCLAMSFRHLLILGVLGSGEG